LCRKGVAAANCLGVGGKDHRWHRVVGGERRSNREDRPLDVKQENQCKRKGQVWEKVAGASGPSGKKERYGGEKKSAVNRRVWEDEEGWLRKYKE